MKKTKKTRKTRRTFIRDPHAVLTWDKDTPVVTMRSYVPELNNGRGGHVEVVVRLTSYTTSTLGRICHEIAKGYDAQVERVRKTLREVPQ